MSFPAVTARTRLYLLPLECRVNPSFVPQAPVPTDLANSNRLVTGRFNADTFADVGVSNLVEFDGPTRPPAFSPTLSVRTGTGGGGFPLSQTITTLPYLNDLIAGDFNRDGKTDLAAVSDFSGSGLYVLLGNGDGTFAAPVRVSTADEFAVATGEFTGDGIPDLVTLGFNAGFNRVFTVYAGDGLGGFTRRPGASVTAASGDRILTGDFDRNGTLDVAGFDTSSNRLVVQLGNGNGTFALGGDVPTPLSARPSDFAVADFDGNGLLDVIVLEGDSAVLHRPLGGGRFEAGGTTLTTVPNGGLSRIAVADFDRNGTPDVVLVGRTTDTALVLLNNGGTFTPDANNRCYSVLGGATDVVTADVDGDTNPDFIVLSPDAAGGDVVRAFINDAPDATATTLSISPNPVVFGQPITLTATVRAVVASQGIPQGTVTFRAGNILLGVVPLTNGVAQLVVPVLPAGSYAITAQYGGFTPPAAAPVSRLAGYVYDDFNGDGVKQADEFPISGTTVTLLRVVGTVTTTVGQVTTGDNGYYEFTDLPAGNYTIAETQPAFYVSGKNTIGTVNGNPGSGTAVGDLFADVTLAAGDVGQNYNFGERIPGSFSGFVYADRDNSGAKNGAEPGITGTTVTLFRLVPNGAGFDEVSVGQATTDASGSYRFTNLLPGDYRARETQPAGFNNGLEGAANFRDATVSSFSESANNNFGERARGALTGFITFNPFIGPTVPFSGGRLILVVGVTTTLATATADADGYYQFDNVPTGTYTLRPAPSSSYDPETATVGVIDGAAGSGTSSNGIIINLTFADGQSGQNYNFQVQEADNTLNGPTRFGPTGGSSFAALAAGVPSAFLGSSASGVLVVNRAPTASGLTLDATNAPTGRPITLRITATNAGPFGTPFGPGGGVVEVYNGSVLIARGVLNADGTLVLTVLRPAGPLNLYAVYTGDGNFLQSASSPVAVGVIDPALFAVGSDNGAVVCIYFGSGVLSHGLASLDSGFASGVRPVLSGVTRNGVSDVFVGSGPGGVSRVAVVDGASRQEVFAFQPFEDGFTGGVFVASADFDGDGVADVAVSADQGGGPRVRVFLTRGTALVPVADFFAFESWFQGGARIATGDVNRDGIPDLVVGAGAGGGPRVAVFDGAALANGGVRRVGPDFFAFESTFGGGVYVAVGDTNGDGFGEIIVGAGIGGGPRVVVFDGQTYATNGGVNQIASFYARTPSDAGGVRVAARDLNQDGYAEVMAAAGVANGAHVRAFDGRALALGFDPFIDVDAFPGLVAGVYVG